MSRDTTALKITFLVYQAGWPEGSKGTFWSSSQLLPTYLSTTHGGGSTLSIYC